MKKLFSFEYLLFAAIAISIVLRIINLGSREFWYDEILSLLLSTGQKVKYSQPGDLPVLLSNYTALLNLPIENGLGDLFQTGEKLLKGLIAEPHPPLFFIEQHLWLRLFGNSEIAMRSLIALFSVGAIGGAYGLGRCLLGHRGGLLLAALLGLNPYFLFHSLNVRMYCSLVFWTILSAWSLLELIQISNKIDGLSKPESKKDINNQLLTKKLSWTLVFIAAITGGLLTFYYFLFWLVILSISILWLDRRRWWQYGLYFGIGILMLFPWLWWGTRQQLHNADLDRFATSHDWLEASIRHFQELIQVLGIHLIVGDWASILNPAITTMTGIVSIALLIASISGLWQGGKKRLLAIALLLGIFPLFLMVAVDIITKKFTLGFGWGRSVIFALPGCLLLVTAWLEKTKGNWRQFAAIALLLFYLSVDLTDLGLRPRWMFHQIAGIISEEAAEPTLIVMNSSAWGHVLRLAYYLPPTATVMLLAQNSNHLPLALQNTLSKNSNRYSRILWLESARPVWGKPITDGQRKQIQQILDRDFQLQKTQSLSGTWELDNFTLNLYHKKL